MPSSPQAFRFGPFRLDPIRRELTVQGMPVMLGQRALEVLLALVSRRGELVTKDELMAEVWPGIVVEENNLQVHVSALRKVLGSAGDGGRYLVTVAGRGYRFAAPVELEHADAKPAPVKTAVAAGAFEASHDLPQQLTPLIGRDAELAELAAGLASHRLVTLTGAGGVGKTRLAIEAAGRLAGLYTDGLRFAELAPIAEPQLIAAVVNDAMGAPARHDSAMETVSIASRDSHLLLVLDNCEQVLAEAARVAEALLRKMPRLSILATSRERLAIAGEMVIRVPSLAVPDAGEEILAATARDYAAIRLFADRATELDHRFALTNDNALSVASICRRLDGIPLAIELAVPRLKVMSLEQLDRGLDRRFQLLTAGRRTALPRQQTLHATLDWSYGLLTGLEQLLLNRLSVFSGGATLDSIAAVAADEVVARDELGDLLFSLVEKSLVHADPAGSETRYQLLESTKYYAREKLGSAPELHRRHAEHVAARLAQATAAWETTPTDQWIASYAPDVDSLRGALEWAFASDDDRAIGLDLVGRSHILWAELGLLLEHRRWVDAALATVDEHTPAEVTARLLSWQAGDVRDIDDPAEFNDAMRAADIFRKLGDPFQEGRTLLRAGMARLLPDTVADSERILRAAHDLLVRCGPTKTLARCLAARASARLLAGDANEARALHEAAVHLYRELGVTPS